MNLLLDTHTLIWFFNGDSQLSDKARKAIEDEKNLKFISIASLWEIAIKIGLRKLEFDGGVKEVAILIDINGFEIVPISVEHTIAIERLEFIHRDPFDRIIIAQGLCENLSIVTRDKFFKKYGIKIIWD